MRKLFILFTFLSVSLMGFAEAYCEKVVTTTIDYTSLDVKVTVKKQSATTVRVILDNEHITGIRAGGTFQQWGNGVWENQDDAVANFAQGWTQSGTAWSKDFIFSTYPTTGNFQIYILMDHDAGAPPVAGFTLTSIDIDNECSAPVKTDPALSLNSTAETLDATAPAETFQIVASQSGDGAISYESSNPGIASVDNTGLVTAVGRGNATITVSTAETASYAAASKTLAVTVTGPINWGGIGWLAGSNDKYKLSVSPEISDTYGGKKVEGTNLWIGFPSAAFGTMSITPSDGAGAWKTFALSNFPNQENQFTVECGGTTYTFDVYFADGTTGGGGSDPEPTEIYDVNFALVSLGASATSDNGGTANNAIDNNDGSSWESTHGVDAVKLTIDLGQKRIFNTVQIRWEGAYGKAFTIDVSNDGTDWTTVKSVDETLPGPFPYEQTLEFAKTTARYIRFNGIERGLPYGYNMFSFRVLLPGVSTLTSITLNAAAAIAEAGGAGVALTAQPKDQNGQNMEAEVSWEITPAAAGHMSGSTFIPDQAGSATIRAYNGEIFSPAVTIYAYTGTNVALNKGDADITASGYDDVNNLYPRFAVDDNDGSLWSARVGETGSERVYDAWIVVDLGAYYDINLIAIRWEGACSRHYHVDFSADGSTWRTAYNAGWDAVATHWEYLIGTAEDATKVRFVRVWSTEAVSQYGLKIMALKVYGIDWVDTGDTEAPEMTSASLVSCSYHKAVIAVAATDDNEVVRYHVVDAFNSIDANYVPDAYGHINLDVNESTEYHLTITAQDAANNESAGLPVNFTSPALGNDLALNKPVEASGQDPAWPASNAVITDEALWWAAFAGETGEERVYDAWLLVDLGGFYDINQIRVRWEGACSKHFHIDFSANKSDWRVAYNGGHNAVATHWEEFTDSDVDNTKVRYVRVWSTEAVSQYGIKIMALRVYGVPWVPASDAENPEMVSATLVSNTHNSAIISVSATDDNEVVRYHVVDADNSVDAEFAPTDGKITVNGLNPETAYHFTITAIDAVAKESENYFVVNVTTPAYHTVPTEAATVPTWPEAQVKSLYSDTYSFAPASLNSYNEGWYDNPNMTEGIIDGNHYLHYDLYRVGMIGWQYGEISVNSMEKLHVDIFASKAGSLTIRPITNGGPNTPYALNLAANQWNSFDIALTEFAGHDWTKLFQFAIEAYQAGGLVGEHISVDNVYFYRESAIEDDEKPTNVSASAEAFFCSLKLTVSAEDNSDDVHFVVMNGENQVAVGDAVSGEVTTLLVKNLTPGTEYSLNVIASDAASNEADPVIVVATTLAAPAAAPEPTLPSDMVKSIYSEKYTSAIPVGVNFNEWWYQSPTIAQEVSLGGNNARYYGGLNTNGYFGIAWNGDNKLDAAGYQIVHFHIYPTYSATIEIYPVIAPEGEFHRTSQTLVGGQWNEVIFDYSDKTFAPFNQIGVVYTNALGDFFIDNLYFEKSPDLVRDDDWMAPGELGTICIPQGAVAQGGDIYELVGKNSEGKIVFATVPNNEMTPGKPYLFEATSNAMKFYYTAESEAAAPVNTGAMKGTFADITLPDTDLGINDLSDIYYFADHALWSCADISTLSVPANRAYVKLSEVDNIGSSSPAPGRRYITMGVNGKDAATGFDQLNASEAPLKMIIDGQLFILRGEKLYDATGRLVK